MFIKKIWLGPKWSYLFFAYNIEALADDEHVAITQCFGKGSVDCPKSHRKVEYVFGGYSLEGLY